MTRVAIAILLIVASVIPLSAFASDTKVGGRLFADWRMDLSDSADSENSFNLTRTYIDIKSKISDNTSLRFTLDLRELGSFDGYSIILKYGYLNWKPEFANGIAALQFGLHPTHYTDNMNKLWGRRYLEKTASDKNKYLTTSDMGVSLNVALGQKSKWGSASLSIRNGTSYTDVTELNKQKDLNVYVLLKPFAGNKDFDKTQVQGQIYTGTLNEEIPDSLDASYYDRSLISFGGLLAYQNIFSAGLDFNFYSSDTLSTNIASQAVAKEVKETAHSIFANLYLGGLTEDTSPLRHINLFGRIDFVDPDTDAADDAHTLTIIGIESAPVKGIKTSLNFRSQSFDDSTKQTKKFIYLNWLIKI